jgi:hypothetical protein
MYLCDQPGTPIPHKAERETDHLTVPYLILLRMGFTLRSASRRDPVVSYTTFSPLPFGSGRLNGLPLRAVCFLWH